MKKVVVLTGAGMSAESGISTFRDAGGLWEGHDVYEVATWEGFSRNPQLVLDFYNQRRKALLDVKPNEGHKALVELEKFFDVHIITQNVDDLHERAGSKKILHLHGELLKVQSCDHPHLVYEWKKDLKVGDKCEKGSQLRPFIIWFGEQVPNLPKAAEITSQADILIIIGTSMVVYPAAGLVNYTRYEIPKYVVDPKIPEMTHVPNVQFIQARAGAGVPSLVKRLIANEQH